MINVRYTVKLTGIAFILHLIWENTQAPFFAGYQSFSQHFPMCFVGTIGDVVVTLLILAFMRLLKKDMMETIADFTALAIIGFIVAIGIEQRALLVGSWDYAQVMPVIPWFNVGLLPVIQMTLLLPLSFYLAKIFNQNHKHSIKSQ